MDFGFKGIDGSPAWFSAIQGFAVKKDKDARADASMSLPTDKQAVADPPELWRYPWRLCERYDLMRAES